MCMWDADAVTTEFHSQVIRKARKRHKCGECKRFIEPGERYERVVGKWDGDIETYLTCVHCVGARHWLEIECGGWLYTCIREDLEEHLGEQGPKKNWQLVRLVIGMRRAWKCFTGPGLMPVPTDALTGLWSV